MANLVVQGEKRFDRLLWMRLINQVLFTGTVITLIFLKQSTLTSIIITYILCNLIASLATIFVGWSKIESIRYTTKETFWEIFHFGKYSMGTSLSSNLFKVTDNFFLNFFLGPSAIALYNLGSRLVQIVEIPMLSFAASGMPSLSAHYNNDQKDQMIYTMKKMIGILSVFIISAAAFSVIFAEPIIGIIGGQKYIHSVAPNIFRIFMFIAVFAPIDRFFALTLDVIHKPQINFYKILVMLVINLIADYVAVTYFKSVIAVAITNILPILAAIIISYVPLNRYIKFDFWNIYVIGYKEIISYIKGYLFRSTAKKNSN
jgi:O-antigen/teichoic acid export membrane protein